MITSKKYIHFSVKNLFDWLISKDLEYTCRKGYLIKKEGSNLSWGMIVFVIASTMLESQIQILSLSWTKRKFECICVGKLQQKEGEYIYANTCIMNGTIGDYVQYLFSVEYVCWLIYHEATKVKREEKQMKRNKREAIINPFPNKSIEPWDIKQIYVPSVSDFACCASI